MHSIVLPSTFNVRIHNEWTYHQKLDALVSNGRMNKGNKDSYRPAPFIVKYVLEKTSLVVGDRSISSRAFLYSSPFLDSSPSARLLRVLFEEYDRQCMLWKREEMNRIMRSPWTGLLLSPISVFWVNLVMYEFISCWWIL